MPAWRCVCRLATMASPTRHGVSPQSRGKPRPRRPCRHSSPSTGRSWTAHGGSASASIRGRPPSLFRSTKNRTRSMKSAWCFKRGDGRRLGRAPRRRRPCPSDAILSPALRHRRVRERAPDARQQVARAVRLPGGADPVHDASPATSCSWTWTACTHPQTISIRSRRPASRLREEDLAANSTARR